MVLRGATDFMLHRPNSFELYGADFMVDEVYHPWLLEVGDKSYRLWQLEVGDNVYHLWLLEVGC